MNKVVPVGKSCRPITKNGTLIIIIIVVSTQPQIPLTPFYPFLLHTQWVPRISSIPISLMKPSPREMGIHTLFPQPIINNHHLRQWGNIRMNELVRSKVTWANYNDIICLIFVWSMFSIKILWKVCSEVEPSCSLSSSCLLTRFTWFIYSSKSKASDSYIEVSYPWVYLFIIRPKPSQIFIYFFIKTISCVLYVLFFSLLSQKKELRLYITSTSTRQA